MNKSELATHAIENGISTVVLLEGQAPEQYNPKSVDIQGQITTPALFIAGKGENFDKAKSHCIVYKDKGIIDLFLNEQSVTEMYFVQGKLRVAREYDRLNINQDKAYDPVKLGQALKMRRSIFPDKVQHAEICSTLFNLNAKVTQTVRDFTDQRGNEESQFKQAVHANIPESFTINIPLVQGEPAEEIRVSIILQSTSGRDIKCYLESIDAQEKIDEILETRIDEEVKKIEKFTTVMYG